MSLSFQLKDFYFTHQPTYPAGPRQARGEVRHQVRLQGVQPGVPAAEGLQPGADQVVAQQGRCPNGGRSTATTGPHRRRNHDSNCASLNPN